MPLYAIADLHLSGNTDKPMDIFGTHWENHAQKIALDWCKKVQANDTVLLPGDISWAMTLDEAMLDLQWINELPGSKILLRGNHDYWWKSITKLNTLFSTMHFVQNNYFTYDDFAICGSRGWVCPNDKEFSQHDEKIYQRELQRLELSLQAAIKTGYESLITMLHYPPTNDKREPSGFTALAEQYGVKHLLYGHLHSSNAFSNSLQGERNGVNYHLVSCDYLDFKLLRVL